mgnify:CR=1 FL=1
MKKTLIGLLGSTVICVLFLAGCIDEHYGEDSNTIVTNLTGYAWERTFQIRTEDGRDAEVCEHYEFGLNGKASCKSRRRVMARKWKSMYIISDMILSLPITDIFFWITATGRLTGSVLQY